MNFIFAFAHKMKKQYVHKKEKDKKIKANIHKILELSLTLTFALGICTYVVRKKDVQQPYNKNISKYKEILLHIYYASVE